MNTINLHNKVALICGAGAGGIGSAVTRVLAAAGASIAAVDVADELNEATRRDPIAHGVLFLVSDLASGINGQTVTIDAGLSCANPAGPLRHFEKMLPGGT